MDATRDRLGTPQVIKDWIESFIADHELELVRDTSRILQFRTVSGGSDEQEREYEKEIPACFRWLSALAAGMGFEFETHEGVLGVIKWTASSPDAPVIAIPTHIDVVTPVGEWTHGPFSGDLADGFIWGRGAQDDKGPLIQVLYALWAIRESGAAFPCTVHVVIGTMEETNRWDDMELYLELYGPPSFGFTPDADFPIINGEKGFISLMVDAEWPRVGTHADTGIEFVTLNGGERENIVPSLAELTIRFPEAHRNDVMKELVRTTTEFVVEHKNSNITLLPQKERRIGADRHEAVVSFIGRAAHSSTPEKGHNAIQDSLEFLRDIDTIPQPVRSFALFLGIAAFDNRGVHIGLDSSHDFIGGTTVNLSTVRVDAKGGHALVNVRPTMGMSCERVIEIFTEAARQFSETSGLPLRVTPHGSPQDAIYLDPKEPALAPYIESLQQGFQMVTGLPPTLRATAGTTYAKAIPNSCAFGPVLLPGDPDLLHQPDERVSVSAVLRNAKVYGVSLALLALKDLPPRRV